LTYRKYTGNDGVERNVTEIIADKIELCGAKPDAPSQPSAPAARPQYHTTPIVDDLPDDDTALPF
jgi:single-stranded DNA-binding protein